MIMQIYVCALILTLGKMSFPPVLIRDTVPPMRVAFVRNPWGWNLKLEAELQETDRIAKQDTP